MEGVESPDIVTLQCLMSFKGSVLAAGIRRAVGDVEAIAAGRAPDRPSEETGRSAQDVEEEMEADSLVTAVLSQAKADCREPFTWVVKAHGGGEMEIAVYCGEAVRVYRAGTDPTAPGGILVEECQTA